MPSPDDPRYAEWKAAFERLMVAQDRLHEASASEKEKAQTEHASALAAYRKICDEMVAAGDSHSRASGRDRK
jgi:hypothetical protein